MRPLPVLLLALLCTTPLAAQVDVEDSAAIARALWRDAGEALDRGDSLHALASLDSAVLIWPRQPAYPRAVSRLAGRLGLAERALPALERLTALGAGWPETDPAYARILGDPRVRAAAARNRSATEALTRSRVLWELGNNTLLVEGVASDSVTGRFYLSSVRTGKIFVRERDGRAREFVTQDSGASTGVLGMAVDGRRGLLWATTAEISEPGGDFPAFSGKSTLVAFDLATGARRATVQLPEVEGGHQLGDVIVTARGTAFASDSRFGAVYRIPVGPIPATAESVVEGDPAFRSLQGMALSPDESVLYLADYSHGLLRVDLRTREVAGISGPDSATLLGIDGMVEDGPRRLIAVQNGLSPVRVVRLYLSSDGRQVERLEVIDRPRWEAGEATLGVRVGRSFVYVATIPAVLRILDLGP